MKNKSLIQKLRDGDICLSYRNMFDKIDDLQKVIKVAFPHDKRKPHGWSNYYFLSNINLQIWECSDEIYIKDRTGISLSEFIKELEMKNKKIIGYKSPMDFPDFMEQVCISKGELYVQCRNKNYYVPAALYDNQSNTGALWTFPAKIVETWEPVYEEVKEEKVFSLDCDGGVFSLHVNKEGIFYKPENARLSIEDIETICKSEIKLHARVGNDIKPPYIVKLNGATVDLGCKKQVQIKQLREVLNYYNSIK